MLPKRLVASPDFPCKAPGACHQALENVWIVGITSPFDRAGNRAVELSGFH